MLTPKNNSASKNNLISKLKNIIGIFDSGLGGLTVFKHLLKNLPGYNYIYLGDNARLPYGEKSQATIYEYTREAMEFLFQKGCNLIIIACNTASSQALRKLQQEYLPKHYPKRRILGVIRPLAEEFAAGKFKKIGVIGTKATILSQAYKTEIKKLNPKIKVESLSTPLLVPLIEEGWAKKPETKTILKKYLEPLKTKQIEALILGCTHYPFLLKEIKEIMGRQIIVPDPGELISQKLKLYLKNHQELGLKPSSKKLRKYYTTDDVKTFKTLGEKFVGQHLKDIKKVNISEL
jgi:glutamate racemase